MSAESTLTAPRPFPQARLLLVALLVLASATVLVSFGLSEWAAAAALAAAVLPLLASKNRTVLAVALVIMIVPANMYVLPSALPFDLEPYRLAVFVLVGTWIVGLLIDPTVRARRTMLDVPLVMLVVSAVLSVAVNARDLAALGEFTTAFKALLYLVTLVALYYATVSLVPEPEQAIRILKRIVVVAAVLGVFGAIERVSGFAPFRRLHEVLPVLTANPRIAEVILRGGVRVYGSAAHPIAFAAMLGVVFPFSVQFALSAKRRAWFWVITSGLILVGMLVTVSRTGLLMVAFATAIIVWRQDVNRAALVIALLAAMFLVHMAFPGVLRKFVDGLTPQKVLAQEVGNRAGRLEDYPRMWAETGRRPLVGRGFGTFLPDKYFFVDNQFLKQLVECGVLGLASLFGLVIAAVVRPLDAMRKLTGQRRAIALAAGASAVGFGVCTATFDSLGFPQVPYAFLLIMALAVSVMRTDVVAEGTSDA